MGLGSCYSCIKYLMFAFNFLFWLLGCAILGIGIWLRVDPNFKQYVTEDFEYLYNFAYVLIAVGAIIMIIGFLGCCGAIRESQCMLATFFVFLFIIFAVLLGLGIAVVIKKDEIKLKVEEDLQRRVQAYDPSKPETTAFMDNLQTNLQCCGATNGFKDYEKNNKPESCHFNNTNKSCSKELFNFFSENMIIIGGVAIGIGIVMVMGMIFSMCLCCEIRKLSDDTKYV